MRSLIIFCAVCCLSVCAGYDAEDGVGVFAYQDSTGKRYSGTFNPKDSQFGPQGGDFSGFAGPGPEFFNAFFPAYFKNLQVLLNEAFEQNIENQKLAFGAATKAYDLTSNQAGFAPNFVSPLSDFGSAFGGFNPGFSGFGGIPNYGMNFAYASGLANDGFVHQTAGINPPNPNMPNVDVTSRSAEGGQRSGQPHFVSVQSSSYATSANVNGKEESRRGASTVVNKDGKITEYKVGN